MFVHVLAVLYCTVARFGRFDDDGDRLSECELNQVRGIRSCWQKVIADV